MPGEWGWARVAGRKGTKTQIAALTLLAPLQVLRGGDPAEGQDFPADANGEGRNAHQGGPAWRPHVSAACVGAGEGRLQAQAAAGCRRGLSKCSLWGFGGVREEEKRGRDPAHGKLQLGSGIRQGLPGTGTSRRACPFFPRF